MAALLENLAQALARREAVLRQDPGGGYRLVHAEGDLLPGLVVDYYAGHAVVQATAHAWEGLLPQVAEALRPYVQSVLAKNDARTRELEGLPSTSAPPRGGAGAGPGARGAGALPGGPEGGAEDGGLPGPAGKPPLHGEVPGRAGPGRLQLRGGFALHLALGFREVVAVDSSAEALRRAEENARLNGLGNVRVLEANAFDLLRRLEKEGERFDLVVLDPPAFAKGKKDVERAYRAYKEVNLRAIKLLKEGGILPRQAAATT